MKRPRTIESLTHILSGTPHDRKAVSRMSKYTHGIVLCLTAIYAHACAKPNNARKYTEVVGSIDDISKEAIDYIELLVQPRAPSIAQFAKQSGAVCGGETELDYMHQKCKAKKWKIQSKECSQFIAKRCEMAHQTPSLYFSDVRFRTFFDVGKPYKIVSVKTVTESIPKHPNQLNTDELIEVQYDAITIKAGEFTYGLRYYPKHPLTRRVLVHSAVGIMH